jgi:hypothetical protein
MRSARLLFALTLAAAGCSGSGDDGNVMIRDGGVVRDGGDIPPRDGGLPSVGITNLAAGYTTQGCSNGCQIWNFRINVTLGNASQYFAVDRITGVRIEVGTFAFEQMGLDCDGTWWKAPKMGVTAAQRFTATLFDVADDDMTRPDNATLTFDCKASEDGVIMPVYMLEDTPMGSTTVKATMWGELEDGTPWEASNEAEAFMN